MAFRVITAAEAIEVNPAHCCPPVCTDDAKNTVIGKRHGGRVLPLVGNTRPFIYDATLVGTDQRIYADRITDLLCIIIGGEYAALADQVDSLDVTEHLLPAPGPGLGDLLPTDLAAAMPVDDETDTDSAADFSRRQQVMELLYDMALLRSQHANLVRIDLQSAINAAAAADGTWGTLSDDEREELTLSASPDGGFPLGLPTEVSIVDFDGDNARPAVMIRPEWRAATPLIINTGNYAPWTEAPYISAIRIVEQPDGSVVEYATRENMPELVIDSEPEYVQSLVAVGVLSLDERPAYQPDGVFADLSDSPVANPYLRRQPSAVDNADHDAGHSEVHTAPADQLASVNDAD